MRVNTWRTSGLTSSRALLLLLLLLLLVLDGVSCYNGSSQASRVQHEPSRTSHWTSSTRTSPEPKGSSEDQKEKIKKFGLLSYIHLSV